MSDFLFLSIRPVFASRILDGTKTVEFRRTRPRGAQGLRVVIYASSPLKSIVGVAQVEDIASGSRSAIWRAYGAAGGVSRREFMDYFRGAPQAHAIVLEYVEAVGKRTSLESLRKLIPGFHPPQAFAYLPSDTAAVLELDGAEETPPESGRNGQGVT